MLLVLALCLLAQNGARDGLKPEERARKLAIEREWGEPNMPEWAGPWTVDAVFAPRNGYFWTWPSCMGPVAETGTIQADGRRLAIREDESHRESALWYVPWGDRHYLVPEFRMREFCMQVNDGAEPRSTPMGSWMMRPSDPGRAAQGKPDVPLQWRTLLLDAPIEARVLRVESRPLASPRRNGPTLETRITLHKGARDGIAPDLGFHFGPRGRTIGFVERVDATACVVLLKTDYDDGDALPIVGGSATTRLQH